jgi:2-methylisocitrate lyase-like PEP mutase family enzyme
VEAVRDLDVVRRVVDETGAPVMVNQLHGGKSPDWSLAELQDAGVSIVMYSTRASSRRSGAWSSTWTHCWNPGGCPATAPARWTSA